MARVLWRALSTMTAAAAVVAGLVVPAQATSSATSGIAALALANTNHTACGTNSLGGTGFDTSCTGNSGQPENWGADFVAWVWAQEGISTTGLLTSSGGATPATFAKYGGPNGSVHSSPVYTPQLGDAVVYDSPADYVAVVTAVNSDGSVQTANGDWGGEGPGASSVQTVTLPAGQTAAGSEPTPMNGKSIAAYVTPTAVAGLSGSEIAPADRWLLADGTGNTAADATGAHPLSLTSSGATWATDPTRGTVLSLDGSCAAATSTGPVLNTGGSFSVSAWVNLASNAGYQTFVTQQGSSVGSFYLEYDPDVNKWSWTRFTADSIATVIRAQSAAPAVEHTWTQLTGTYDASTGAMTLYVNGIASGSATDTSPWNAPGPLVIGYGLYNGLGGSCVDADISDVQTYQSALSASQVGQVASGGITAPSGRWRFLEGVGTNSADLSGHNHPVTLSGSDGWATNPVNSLVLNGTGYAATSTPVINTGGSFSVSAWVDLASNAGYQTFVTQQGSSVGGFYLEYDPDVNKWSWTRFASDSIATVIRAQSGPPAILNNWTYLVGTYDASTGAMTLYVNGIASGSATDTNSWNATGPLVIGYGQYNGQAGSFADAAITDVQAYQSVLAPSQVAQMYSASGI